MTMARLPHDVFRLILSFKDPRYERARNGDPYEATPARVWATWKEFEENRSRYTSLLPDPTYARRIVVRKCEFLMVYTGFSNFEFVERRIGGEYAVQSIEDRLNYLRKDPDELETLADAHYTKRIGKLFWRCEACGPDLELYEMMRKR